MKLHTQTLKKQSRLLLFEAKRQSVDLEKFSKSVNSKVILKSESGTKKVYRPNSVPRRHPRSSKNIVLKRLLEPCNESRITSSSTNKRKIKIRFRRQLPLENAYSDTVYTRPSKDTRPSFESLMSTGSKKLNYSRYRTMGRKEITSKYNPIIRRILSM